MSKARKPSTSRLYHSGRRRLIILLLVVVLVAGLYVLWRSRAPILTWPVLVPRSPITGIPFEDTVRQQTAQEDNLVFAGLPKRTVEGEQLLILRNRGFATGYCESRRNPLWVAYRVDPKPGVGKADKRPSRFKVDTRTKSRVRHEDYARSGYDRGHLAPNHAISTRFGREAQLETFLMTNITPKRPTLNQRVWMRLEKLEVKYSNRFGSIWVVTGPVFTNKGVRLRSGVKVPDMFYKILIKELGGNIRTLSFLIPQNVKGNEPLNQFLADIRTIEKVAGFDFFWAISDEHENSLENLVPKEIW